MVWSAEKSYFDSWFKKKTFFTSTKLLQFYGNTSPKRKRKQINLHTKQINRLIGKKIPLSIENKLLVYQAVIKPIWSYGIERRGCASKSNIVIMQRYQSKILRDIANAPRYVTNRILHSDFNSPYVSDVIHEIINKHHNKPEAHPSPLL